MTIFLEEPTMFRLIQSGKESCPITRLGFCCRSVRRGLKNLKDFEASKEKKNACSKNVRLQPTTSGALVSVGMVGTRINIPLFPFVAREFTYHGSFWGNYTDLSEVIALAQAGKIKHSLKRVRFENINENLELLRDGEIVGRAVVIFGASAVSPNKKEMVA